MTGVATKRASKTLSSLTVGMAEQRPSARASSVRRVRREAVAKQASELGVILRREADEQHCAIRLKERTD
jgi:hypothetical protein